MHKKDHILSGRDRTIHIIKAYFKHGFPTKKVIKLYIL